MKILAFRSVAPDFSLDSTPDQIPGNHSPRFLTVLHWTLEPGVERPPRALPPS